VQLINYFIKFWVKFAVTHTQLFQRPFSDLHELAVVILRKTVECFELVFY